MEIETQQCYVGVMDQLVMYTALALSEADDTFTELQEDAASAHRTLENMVNCSLLTSNRLNA